MSLILSSRIAKSSILLTSIFFWFPFHYKFVHSDKISSTNNVCRKGDSPSADNFDTIVFDAYGTLLDLNSLHNAVSKVTSDPTSFLNLWRMKQLNYTWLRTLMGRYKNFWIVTGNALDFTLQKTATTLESGQRNNLMNAWLELSPYPEVRSSLDKMKSKYRLAVLSNGSPVMLKKVFKAAGLDDVIKPIISVDPVGIYKPHPNVYAWGQKVLKSQKSRILFVSSNGWDAIGAQSYGFTSAWVNRAHDPVEQLGIQPAMQFNDLTELATYLDLKKDNECD